MSEAKNSLTVPSSTEQISKEPYDMTTQELQTLMEYRGPEARDIMTELGGVKEICRRLKTDPKNGLMSDDVEKRRNVFGANTIPPKKLLSIWAQGKEAVLDLIVNVFRRLSFKHNREIQPKTTEEVNHFTIREHYFKTYYVVVRKGEMEEIPAAQIVVGDIIQIKSGDFIPADGILIESRDFKVDESMLTGETELVIKSAASDSMVLLGTRVIEGIGTFLVTAVGVNAQSNITFSF